VLKFYDHGAGTSLTKNFLQPTMQLGNSFTNCLTQKQVTSETFFPANLLAQYWQN